MASTDYRDLKIFNWIPNVEGDKGLLSAYKRPEVILFDVGGRKGFNCPIKPEGLFN